MYPKREVFRTPPVALVTAQARFTDAARLRQQETLDAITIGLEGRFGVAEVVTDTSLDNVAPGLPPRVVAQKGLRLRNADSTEVLTLTPSALTFETTVYSEFDDLLATLTVILQALVQAQVRPALKRVGLRYIDEIRVPEPVSDVRAWDTWIDGRLIGALALVPEEVPVRGLQTALGLDLGEGAGLNVGYAVLPEGSVVNVPHLRKPAPPAGPCFVLDLDGFCEFNGEVAVLLDTVVVTDILAAVHGPIGAVFQSSITDKAREIFRRDAASRGPRHGLRTGPHLPVGRDTDTLDG